MAELSNTLFYAALFAYLAAMVAYFFSMAYTRVRADGVLAGTRMGDRAGLVAVGLTAAGAAAHLASIGARWVAAGRVPWANMYEYSAGMAFLAVIGGAVVLRRRGYPHLMGFVLAAAVLMMASALLLYTDAGPLVPALESIWLKIHTFAMMFGSSVFIVGFAFTALYLAKDAAERRVAATDAYTGSTVGAGAVVVPADRPEGYVDDAGADVRVASPLAQREMLSPVLFPVVPFVAVGLFALAVYRAPTGAFLAATVAALLGIATWYAVPYLPPAAQLDNLAYRTIAFGFPVLTFGVLCGAIWAEVAWGRYWGWDPKETGSFFTWVLYAAYLHARSTRGWRGPRAAWTAVIAFVALMVTYYMVNLWIFGLHSYAGV